MSGPFSKKANTQTEQTYHLEVERRAVNLYPEAFGGIRIIRLRRHPWQHHRANVRELARRAPTTTQRPIPAG